MTHVGFFSQRSAQTHFPGKVCCTGQGGGPHKHKLPAAGREPSLPVWKEGSWSSLRASEVANCSRGISKSEACTGSCRGIHAPNLNPVPPCPRWKTLTGQHPALLRVLCGFAASPTAVLEQPLCSEWWVAMALAPWGSLQPGFLPNQVTGLHPQGREMLFLQPPASCVS